MRLINGILLAALAACGGSGKPEPKRTPKAVDKPKPKPAPPKKLTLEERLAVHEGCFKAWVGEDEKLFDRCYTDESTEEDVDSGEDPREGIDEIRAGTRPFWDGFTMAGDTLLTLASGDEVITVNRLTGTHDGPYMEVAASGKKFGLLYAEVQTIDDKGRVAKVRVYFDNGTMLGQLGMTKAKVRPAEVAAGGEAPRPVITGQDAETEEANANTVKGGFELFNKRDWKGLVALYAADAVVADQLRPADAKGAKGIDKLLKELTKAFPDAHEEVGTMWSAGDYVIAATTFTGTNKAAAPGMGITKATKKPVKLQTLHVLRLADGKVAEQWIFGNGVALATQLGLVPPAK